MKEWTSVPIGSPWDRMKQLGSHTTTERTNRRQEQEFRAALKTGDFLYNPKFPASQLLSLLHAFTLVSSSAYYTLKKGAKCSSETSVHTRSTRCHISEGSSLGV
jgi:hypothetical protein